MTVAGADHVVNVTAPDAFAELVTAFTAGRSRRSVRSAGRGARPTGTAAYQA
ncbi:hypothetical protein OHV05_30235 [Kitasatospora sp. NBC_00070]|uniref:hypothetical protein n=1 Tax=Kitasatospora sp. NBC_00070 TaxID=2975962 RepID=UPI003247DD39